VAQVQSRQLRNASTAATAAAREMDCTELLVPATALLHLPPLQVPAQQLLLQHLAGTHAALPVTLQQLGQHSSKAGAAAATAAGNGVFSLAAPHSDGIRTPSRPVAGKNTHQQQLDAPIKGAASLQPSTVRANGQPGSYTGADVVPPTPYSAMQEDGPQQHADDIVIEDSQESEGHVPDSIMRDAAAPAVAADVAAGAAVLQGTDGHGSLQQQLQQEPARALGTKHVRELLLQHDPAAAGGSSYSLLLLPSVLVQKMGFAEVAGVGIAQLAHAVMQLEQQLQQHPVHLLLQLNSAQAGMHGSHGSSISFAWFSSKAVHVELHDSSSSGLDVLQQLLLTAVQRLPGVSVVAFCVLCCSCIPSF
jgi:hypothetical protein